MGNSNNKILTNLIKQLEFLARKCNPSITVKKDNYFNIYDPMTEFTLLQNFQKSFKECEKKLDEILNSNNYSPGSILNETEIDEYINQLIKWKQLAPKYKYQFEKTKQLLNKIQNKDYSMTESSMDIEKASTSSVTTKTSYGTNYAQKLVDKQLVTQAQELALLNDNFGRALASLECFANRYSATTLSNVFNYYDMFNLGNTQDLTELYKKAYVQIQIFNLAYADYIRKYKAYSPPENINILEIKNLLEVWMKNVPIDFQIMYKGMINIICRLNNKEFEQKFVNYSQQFKNAKMDPSKIASFAPGIYYYNYQRTDEAKNEYLVEGKITSKLNINQSYKDDKKAERLQKIIEINNINQQNAIDMVDLK